MFCEGQLLPISENETLFQLIGTTYGGDGESTFALPDLRGRIPDPPGQRLHPGRDGRRGGDHPDRAADPGPQPPLPGIAEPGAPSPRRRATCPRQRAAATLYRTGRRRRPTSTWRRNAIAAVGGSQPHTNFQPYLCVELHHLAVRDLPDPHLGGRHGRSIRRRDPDLPVQLRAQRAGRGATASSCRCQQNTALFSLLGTTYGGNGKSNFALPDLQGRAPMHPGQGPGLSLHDLGETGGSETVTLLESEIPAHSHAASGRDAADRGHRRCRRHRSLATAAASTSTRRPAAAGRWPPAALAPAGGDQPHNNLSPT